MWSTMGGGSSSGSNGDNLWCTGSRSGGMSGERGQAVEKQVEKVLGGGIGWRRTVTGGFMWVTAHCIASVGDWGHVEGTVPLLGLLAR